MAVLSFCSFSYSNAQTVETTPNLITNTWNNVTTGAHPNNCCTGGSAPLYDPATNTIHFSYGLTAVHQVQAINQALSGSGIQINGWNWGYDLRNMNGVAGGQGGTDSIAVTSFMTNSAGQIIKQSDQHYNTQFDWTRFIGTEILTTPHSLANSGSLGIQFVSGDSGFWAGYYGPQVRNVSLTANYTVDQCAVNPQSSPTCPGYRTYYQMWDDGYAQVNLPFAFPFYGFNFTTSYMFTNGVIGFLNPNNAPGGYCCDGVDLNQQRFTLSSPWNFAIYALNTDLIPGPNSQFYTESTNNGQGLKYTWYKVPEIGTNLENTFSVELRNTGYIGINYQEVNLSPWRSPLIGIAGDTYQGTYKQYYFGSASSMPNLVGSTITFTGTETTDICTVNPLSNPSCPGYAQAYFNQQCTISPLYNSQCPGYAQAYFTQQCSANPLYDVNCPGYATAYYNYQCSANPLYHTGCPGYEQAYFTQQCTANPLYSVNCSGYADAYYVQQCTANPLYDVGCTGYQQAYFNQQCTANPLYNSGCPGYATAYFNQQCSANALYDKTCPGYAEAYALKYVVVSPSNTSTNTSTPTTTIVLAQATSDPVAQAAPVVADPVVNNVVTTKSTATTSAASPAAVVQLTQPAPSAVTATAVKEEKKEEKKTETASSSSSTTTTTTSNDNKNETKSTRQALAERRLEAARSKAVEEGKQLANKMGEAATMEAQVAVQNVVVQAMGFTPGWDSYGKVNLQDAAGYRPFEIYQGQRNIDNPSGRRFMTGSDRLHSEMVDGQYNLGK